MITLELIFLHRDTSAIAIVQEYNLESMLKSNKFSSKRPSYSYFLPDIAVTALVVKSRLVESSTILSNFCCKPD